MSQTRRSFLQNTGLITAGAAAFPALSGLAQAQLPGQGIALGFDNFSIRATGWKAPDLIKYARRQKVDVLMLSDLHVYDNYEDDYLKDIKAQADAAGIQLHAGTGSICPTSQSFNDQWGTAEELLTLTIRVAETLGSPVARCFLGSMRDRKGDGGIEPHIEETIRVCKAVRSRAMDAGVKIAIENHAGDLTGRELAMLIEEAGPAYVGATLDSGNATWILEDPLQNLEALGPYAVSTGIRDSAVWTSENGAMVEWTNVGEGHVDWHQYLKRYQTLCPETPFILEIISGIGAREYAYFNVAFWQGYETIPASQFANFIEMAQDGEPYSQPADRPTGEGSNELQQQQQLYDLEQSLAYCRDELGLGLKT